EAAVEGVEVLETTDVSVVDADDGEEVAAETTVAETPELDEAAAVESIGAAAALLPSRTPAAVDPDGQAFDDAQPAEEADGPGPKLRRTRARRKVDPAETAPESTPEPEVFEQATKPNRTRTRRKPADEPAAAEPVAEAAEPVAEEAPAPKPRRTRRR